MCVFVFLVKRSVCVNGLTHMIDPQAFTEFSEFIYVQVLN